MKDVATAAGVSPSTVSRILNDVPLMVPVTPQTKARVLEAAFRLGYSPTGATEERRRARTMLLGVIAPDMADPVAAAIIEAIADEARARGYSVVLEHGDAGQGGSIAPRPLDASRVDAVIFLGNAWDQDGIHPRLMLPRIPVVVLGSASDLAGMSSVHADRRAGIGDAVAHLVGLGHRRIAFVGGRTPGADAQLGSYRDAVTRVAPGYLCDLETDDTVAGGSDAILALLGAASPPTAVVAASDIIAAGIVRGAADRGLPVPAALSVVGFGDTGLAASLVPALTSVRLPVAAIAAAAVELAVEQAAQMVEARVPRHLHFRPCLVVRESTAPPRVL